MTEREPKRPRFPYDPIPPREVTEYPNREHANADKAARRRALANLSTISEEIATLTTRLRLAESTDNKGVYVEAGDTRRLSQAVTDLTANLARMEMLRDVREWHAADIADGSGMQKAVTGGHPHGGHGPHPGWKGHDDYAVHRHNMTNGRAEWELTRGDGTPVTALKEQRERSEHGQPGHTGDPGTCEQCHAEEFMSDPAGGAQYEQGHS